MRGLSLFTASLGPVLGLAQSYTVLTYNIRYANSHDGKNSWDFRKEAVANVVLEHKPSIVGLQEVLRDQLAYLKAQWPSYEAFGVGRDDGFESGEFAPILFDPAMFELLEGRTVWLSPTPELPSKGWDATCNRIVTIVNLRDRSSGDSLWVANTHWDAAGEEARSQSARIVSDLLAGPIARGRRTIFMGDLNAKQKAEPIGYLAGHLQDACPNNRRRCGTFNGFKRLRLLLKRIDYVWLSPNGWKVNSYEVFRPRVKCRQASDHFPVLIGLSAQ